MKQPTVGMYFHFITMQKYRIIYIKKSGSQIFHLTSTSYSLLSVHYAPSILLILCLCSVRITSGTDSTLTLLVSNP